MFLFIKRLLAWDFFFYFNFKLNALPDDTREASSTINDGVLFGPRVWACVLFLLFVQWLCAASVVREENVLMKNDGFHIEDR